MAEPANSVLGDIITARCKRVERSRTRVPLSVLQQAVEARSDFRDFAAAISRCEPEAGHATLRVIAELKHASPSGGVLRQDYRCREIARSYESAGASALSVLTEEDFFRGSLDDLVEVRGAVRVPVLRKDFIVDAYQVYEAVAAGADALLLIVAALEDKTLRELFELSRRLRIAALVEVHTEQELDRALDAGARILGVNNRNLQTLGVDIETSFRLKGKIPAGCLAVSESGMKTAADLRRVSEAGFDAVLIGEHFMKVPDPGRELAEILRLAFGPAHRPGQRPCSGPTDWK